MAQITLVKIKLKVVPWQVVSRINECEKQFSQILIIKINVFDKKKIICKAKEPSEVIYKL